MFKLNRGNVGTTEIFGDATMNVFVSGNTSLVKELLALMQS